MNPFETGDVLLGEVALSLDSVCTRHEDRHFGRRITPEQQRDGVPPALRLHDFSMKRRIIRRSSLVERRQPPTCRLDLDAAVRDGEWDGRRELYVAAHECGPILASPRVALLQQAVACADVKGGHEIACHCGSHDLERRVDERVESFAAKSASNSCGATMCYSKDSSTPRGHPLRVEHARSLYPLSLLFVNRFIRRVM